jgi:hypothetical protein
MHIEHICLKATLAAAPAAIAAIIAGAITTSPGNAQVGFNTPLPADPRPNIPGPDIPGPNVNAPHVNVPNVNVPDLNVPDVNVDLPDVNVPDLKGPSDLTDIVPDFNPPNINRGGGRGRR